MTLGGEEIYRVAWVLQWVHGAEVEGRRLVGKDRLRPGMELRQGRLQEGWLQDRSLGPSSCRSPSLVLGESETNRYHRFLFSVFS